MKQILLTGMSGCGKSTLIDHLDQKGIPTFYTGSIIPKNVSEREKINFGKTLNTPTAFIEKVYEAVQELYGGRELVMIDSIRSETEFEFMKAANPYTYLLALLCARPERHRRIRENRGTLWEDIQRRDNSDLGIADSPFHVGRLIAQADFYVDNTYTVQQTYEQLEDVIRRINDGN